MRSDRTTDYFEIVQRETEQEIVPGARTTVWGYNGTFPGPTIESRSGRRTVVRHRNDLPVPTVVHLHGARTPPENDGYPIDLVLPKGGDHGDHSSMEGGDVSEGQRTYAYPMQQRAATLWYHDHRMDFTGPAVWRGLAGFHIVRDDEEEALDLPAGDREVPLMICDRAFASDGSFLYPSRDDSLMGDPGVEEEYMDGVLGDVMLVNGAPWPVLDVAATTYRFRILNACNARRLELGLDPAPDDGFTQIGSDGGLLGSPVSHDTIPIAQAERFDVVIDFSGYDIGDEITLTNGAGDGDMSEVMRFRVASTAPRPEPLPEKLADMSAYDELDESAAEVTRSFEFEKDGERDGMEMWTVNGKLFDPERIDAKPARGSIEVWELHSDPAHPIHLHQVSFKVLSRNKNDDEPLPTDIGWKDTVDLKEGETAHVLVKFDSYPGKYVFHCHNLEHEDMAMMANFEIT
ncbi:multicopper oxidase family protein [Solicola gregarius]|uniref:Multicopper oxidase family protein n=1 Tax=Solicola gregarius TaxID=2908642 RepID=A0AA46TNG3_9ACTN|nr:multicopper oxidase family protein [Solicola gregarius]UYM07598.1 multicopper oxidase family protein [Solicola gregarius]